MAALGLTMRRARKVAPRVKDGLVQKKDRHQFTASLGYVLYRESPNRGHRHVVSKRDLRQFTDLIPDWSTLSHGLEAIRLSSGDDGTDGFYRFYNRENTGTIALSALPSDLWVNLNEQYFGEHRHIFDRIGVSYDKSEDGWICRFTASKAKAFMLLHVFVHELGHHVDRMSTKNKRSTPKGEDFAERFANDMLEELWPRYVQIFGKP